MIRFEFRFRHGCPFALLSEDFPEVPFSLWSNMRTKYIELATADAAVSRAMQSRLQQMLRAQHATFRPVVSGLGPSCLMVKYGSVPKASIPALFDRNSVVLSYPIDYLAGWERYRSIVLDDSRLPQLVHRLQTEGALEILRKRSTEASTALASMLVSWEEIFADLTARQKTALLTAIQNGYYEVPRKRAISDIAAGGGVSRTTFGQHVQKAEGKLMRAVAPFLSLEVLRPRDPPVSPAS